MPERVEIGDVVNRKKRGKDATDGRKKRKMD